VSHPAFETHDAGRADLATSFTRLVAESGQQLANVAQAAQPLVGAWVGLLRMAATLPGATMSSARSSIGGITAEDGCCEIPVTDCPPRCVCEVVWEGMHDQNLAATITVTNTRKVAQNFALSATPFEGPSGISGASATVSPANIHLNAGGSATVKVEFVVPKTFAAGDAYDAEVRVLGLYEQCVRLRLHVRPVPHCAVKQGEIPTHIRAHRWYEHFQCEELCFEPAHAVRHPGLTVPPAQT
jgi:hypothetical protein